MWSPRLYALLSASFWLLASAAPSTSCNDYVIIETRGTTERQDSPSIAFRNMTRNTLDKLKGGANYRTVYPANTKQSSLFAGAADIVKHIDDGLKACPHQKYALLGYVSSMTHISVRSKSCDTNLNLSRKARAQPQWLCITTQIPQALATKPLLEYFSSEIQALSPSTLQTSIRTAIKRQMLLRAQPI